MIFFFFSIKECCSIEDKNQLREFIYRIGMQVIIGDATADIIVTTLYEIVKKNNAIVNILSDVLAILDIESQVMDKNYRDNFISFLNLANNVSYIFLKYSFVF